MKISKQLSKLAVMDQIGRMPIDEQNKIYKFARDNRVSVYDIIVGRCCKGIMHYSINTDNLRVQLHERKI